MLKKLSSKYLPSVDGMVNGVTRNAKVLLVAIAIMFALEVVDLFLPQRLSLDQFGISPRSLTGLLWVPVAPWLHGGFGHVVGNAIPLFALGLLISVTGLRRLAEVAGFTAVGSGLGIYLFGATNSVHIGASGVVYGLMGYALLRGFVEKRPMAILVSLLVGAYMLLNLVPLDLLVPKQGISWSGHIFGFLSGLLAAKLLPAKSKATADVPLLPV